MKNTILFLVLLSISNVFAYDNYFPIYAKTDYNTLLNKYSEYNYQFSNYLAAKENKEAEEDEELAKLLSQKLKINKDEVFTKTTVLSSSVDYDSQKCLVFYTNEDYKLYYYSFDKKKVIKEKSFDDERMLISSEMFLGVFNKDYEFDFYHLGLFDKVRTIKADSIITNYPKIIDDKFIMSHAGGLSCYNILTGAKLWQYREANLFTSRIFEKDSASIYFISDDKLALLNLETGEVINDFEFSVLNAEKIYLQIESFDIINFKNDSSFTFEGVESGEYQEFSSNEIIGKKFYDKIDNDYYFYDSKAFYKINFEDKTNITKIFDIEEIKRKYSDSTKQHRAADVDLYFIHKNIVYPEIAMKYKIEGKFVLRILVSRSGLISLIQIEPESENAAYSNPIFFQNSAEVILKADFEPAQYDNEPIASWLTFPFMFRFR